MIRYTLLFLAVSFLALYSFKDWYRSLCGAVVLMAFIERYDMPRQMLGISGINPWNILMLFVVLGCILAAKKEKLEWDFPPPAKTLLYIYFCVGLIGIVRLASNFGYLQNFFVVNGQSSPSLTSYLMGDFLNTIKYAVPGLLMFYGCNSRSRYLLGFAAILLTSFFLGLQIIKWMPIGELANAEVLSNTALRVLDRAIGYHRVDLAALMASASWGFFVVRDLAPNKLVAWCFTGLGVVLILALALTGGRTGYGTWLILAAMFTAIKWRRLVFLVPVFLIFVIAVVPAARDRMLVGFGADPEDSGFSYEDQGADLSKITSDRNLIWPIIIDEIGNRPLVGHGRQGLIMSGAGYTMREVYGERGRLNHPHNAYLELLIDNGLLGALPILYFFYIVMIYSARLFRSRASPVYVAAGGLAMALVAGQLIASIGGQSFYPRAGVVLMWCGIGLALRAYADFQKSEAAAATANLDEPNRTTG